MLKEDEPEEKSETQETISSTESLPVIESLKMHVFVRIRPTSIPEIDQERRNDVYSVDPADSTTLLVRHLTPNESARRIKFLKSNDNPTKKRLTFSKIFNLEIDQSQIFNETIKPCVIDFLNNQSSTVISYGTSDAGKTYTLFGTATQPGVIPRSIELIYSSLNCTLDPWYKPERFGSVINLDEFDRTLEIEARDKLLSCRLVNKTLCEEVYKLLENLESNEFRDDFNDSMYSVWISFIEIYNDGIFDLLQTDEEGRNVQLKLSIDKHGETYIQGLQSVCATTGLEAYEIMNAGQSRLSTFTLPNYKSSRSHAIFTIKLLKYDKDDAPDEVKISTLSFYDLAGAGRKQKSVGSDKQFKESKCINTSLLALGRCLKVIAEGHSRQSIGPFRDSKLTRLFQHSLCGKENIILLININPTLELYTETQNVLSFASTAMKLASEFGKEDKKVAEFRSPMPTPKSLENSLPVRCSSREKEVDDIVSKNKQLTSEIKELKSTKIKKEYEIRQELTDFYAKKINELEENWKNRILIMEEEKESLLKISVTQLENYYKDKLEECTTRKRKRIDRGDYEEQLEVEVFEGENTQFSSKIVSFGKSFEFIKDENKQLNAQNNQQTFKLSLIKESLKKLVEFTNIKHEKLENFIDFKTLSVENDDGKVSLDEDVTLYLSTIQDIIVKAHDLEKALENFKEIKDITTKEAISELTLLKRSLNKLAEFVNTPNEKLETINLCIKDDVTKALLDKDVISCLMTIQNFINKSFYLEKSLKEQIKSTTHCKKVDTELLLLKESLKKLVDYNNTPSENRECCFDFENLEEENDDVEKLLDKDVILYLTSIKDIITKSCEKDKSLQNLIDKSYELEKLIEESKQEKEKSDMEIQCDSNNLIIYEFCKEIQELLEPNFVSLPSIDDSLDPSCIDKNENENIDYSNLLSKIKELVSSNVSKFLKCEAENVEKSEQLRHLENQNEQLNKEILQMKLEYQNSESDRLSLLEEVKNLKSQLQSKEYFNNVNLVEPEDSSTNKTENMVFTEQQSTPRHSLDDNSRLSLFESDSEKNENSVVRSSSDSSRNDSGVASSIECVICKETDDKYCQTNHCEDRNHSIQDRLIQLKLDYKQMKAQHQQESLRVTELSQELEYITEAMIKLKDSACNKEKAIIEYQSKLNINKAEIENVSNEKRQLEVKCNELNKKLEEVSKEYEKKLTESQVKLKVHEEGETRNAKCLEDYWEKSVKLGGELSIAYSELDKISKKCLKEHVLKIDKLKQEINERKFNESALETKISEYEKDIERMNDLSNKVNKFENVIDSVKKEKLDLQKLIEERSNSQAEIDEQLKYLVIKIEERDNHVLLLKNELATIIKTNLSNSRKAKELGKEVVRLMEKICTMKEDLVNAEEARKDLEHTSTKEICALRARLTIFEENAELLNMICDTNENKQSEVEKLKLKLFEKEKELEFFKKNRNSTIQRYECLVRQLQDALKMSHNRTSKLKKIFTHKQKYFFNVPKDNLPCNIHGSEPQIRNWKSLNDEYSYLVSSTSIAHSSSADSSADTSTSKEEPSRLVTDISEKCLETGRKEYSIIHHTPTKDIGLLSDFENSQGLDPYDSDSYPIKKLSELTKSQLRHRKSHKEFN